MNAAAVRPHVAVDRVVIKFDYITNDPIIQIFAENVGSFPAYDWEWVPLIKYRVGEERKTTLFPWGKRGVAGIDLLPGKGRNVTPKHIKFPLTDIEYKAACAIANNEGLHVFVTIFTRLFDVFGNQVDDKHHFFTLVTRMSKSAGNYTFSLQHVPPGTQIEGQEDRIPPAPNP